MGLPAPQEEWRSQKLVRAYPRTVWIPLESSFFLSRRARAIHYGIHQPLYSQFQHRLSLSQLYLYRTGPPFSIGSTHYQGYNWLGGEEEMKKDSPLTYQHWCLELPFSQLYENEKECTHSQVGATFSAT